MSKLLNLNGFLAASCVLVIGMLGSQVWAFDVPNDTIPAPGAPSFGNVVKVDLNTNSGRLRITGNKDFFFDNAVDPLFVGNGSRYSLIVDFNKNTGVLEGGSLTLKGGIDALGIPKQTTLVTADVTGWNLTDSNLWGFATENIVCSPLLLITCTTSESVWVELDNPFLGDFNARFRTTGFATTTVPLPAAAWLFGSALGFVGWVARKRNPGVKTLAG